MGVSDRYGSSTTGSRVFPQSFDTGGLRSGTPPTGSRRAGEDPVGEDRSRVQGQGARRVSTGPGYEEQTVF